MESNDLKRCATCKVEKPRRDQFHRNRTTRDGLERFCKKCAITKNAKRWAQVKETARYKEQKRCGQRRYSAKYPEKEKAHKAAKSVKIPAYCERCRAGGVKLHRHHPDYSKPKLVVALCEPCHGIVHQQARGAIL